MTAATNKNTITHMNPIKFHPVKAVLYAALILLSLVCLIPFYMMLVNATRSGNEIITGLSLLPSKSLPANWKLVNDNLMLGRGFLNSLFIAVTSTALMAFFSSMTTYGLAFYKFPGSKLIFTVILVFMMVPAQLGMLGFYDQANKMRMINTYWPLILPSIASSGAVFFLRQYILSVMPKAMLEAPRIDGASEFAIFLRIVMPIMSPAIATMAIGGFIGSWNAYLLPMLMINTPDKRTLPVMVSELSAVRDIATNLGATYLVVAISAVPIMIAFCFFSKYIISGISAGSVKE